MNSESWNWRSYNTSEFNSFFNTSNGSNSTNEYYESEDEPLSTLTIVLVVIKVLVAILTFTLNGCIVIIVGFMIKRKTFSNYLFMVMGGADFIVGISSIPFLTVLTTLGYWPLGYYVCVIWSINDFSSCTISIYCLCAVSLHRLIQLTYPTHASEEMNLRKYIIIAAIVIITYIYWIASIIPISLKPEFDVEACGFSYTFIYNLTATISNYLLPTILIFIINTITFVKMRQRMVQKKAKGLGSSTINQLVKAMKMNESTLVAPAARTTLSQQQNHIDNPTLNPATANANASTIGGTSMQKTKVNTTKVTRSTKRMDKDMKALLALFTITGSLVFFQGIFCVTWPWMAACYECVSELLVEIGYWGTYLNVYTKKTGLVKPGNNR